MSVFKIRNSEKPTNVGSENCVSVAILAYWSITSQGLNYLKLGKYLLLTARFLFASIFWLFSFLQTRACVSRAPPFCRLSDQTRFLSVARRQYFRRVCFQNCAAAVCSFSRLPFYPRWDFSCDRCARVFLFACCGVLPRAAFCAPLFAFHRDRVASSSSWPYKNIGVNFFDCL